MSSGLMKVETSCGRSCDLVITQSWKRPSFITNKIHLCNRKIMRFEWMLYKMELLDHKTRERAVGLPISQGVHMPVLLHHDVAVEALRVHTSRFAVLDAVYEYWKSKRDRWQKPILRRLQPPPPVNDTNPFNVFRPREKVHRPHTRRMQRRENDISSFEKLRQVRRNLEQSRNLMLALQKREEKKRELLECEANLQRVQIKLKHDSRMDDDCLMAANSSIFTPRKLAPTKWGEDAHNLGSHVSNIRAHDQINGHGGSLRHVSELPTSAADGALGDQMDRMRHKRKRRRLPPPRIRPMRRMKAMDSLEPVLLFTKSLDAEKLAASGILSSVEASLETGLGVSSPCRLHGRISRGGRVVFDRWNPLSHAPIGSPTFSLSSPPLMSLPRERFHAPPPARLDLDATSHPKLHSVTTVAVDQALSTSDLLP